MKFPKILIVDDELDIRDILFYIVESKGEFPVEFAESGNVAIEKLKSNSFDLVICDFNMPNGNGADVFQTILALKLKTRFVLCTSNNLSDHKIFVQNKVYGYVQKPSITNSLELILDQLLKEVGPIDEFRIKFIPLTIN